MRPERAVGAVGVGLAVGRVRVGAGAGVGIGVGREARVGRGGRGAVRQVVAEPVEDRPGDVGVVRQQVSGTLEAVHVGLRQPGGEVVEVALEEHRVARPPEEQGGDLQRSDPGSDAVEFDRARVGRVDGDVRDEPTDRTPSGSTAVGRPVGVGGGPVELRVRDRQGGLDERRGDDRGSPEQLRAERQTERSRDRGVRALVHGGVAGRHRDDEVRVVDGPAEGDDTAPVVAERDDGAREPEPRRSARRGRRPGRPGGGRRRCAPRSPCRAGRRRRRARPGRRQRRPRATSRRRIATGRTRSGCRARRAACRRARRRVRSGTRPCRGGARCARGEPGLPDDPTAMPGP